MYQQSATLSISVPMNETIFLLHSPLTTFGPSLPRQSPSNFGKGWMGQRPHLKRCDFLPCSVVMGSRPTLNWLIGS